MGTVYLINLAGTNFYKIGITDKKDVSSRISNLQSANPHEVILLDCKETTNYRDLEKWLHSNLKEYHVRGEWFNVTKERVTAVYNLAVTMFSVDEVLDDDKRSESNMVYKTKPKNQLLESITFQERMQISEWYVSGISKREIARKLYKLRGGKNDNYKGDGPLFQAVNNYIANSFGA